MKLNREDEEDRILYNDILVSSQEISDDKRIRFT
jgi:hypothetical protein